MRLENERPAAGQSVPSDAFSGFHPAVGFVYFGFVLLFSMCLMHPLCLAISLTGALCYSIKLAGRKSVWFLFSAVLPMMLLAAFVNPAFNHEGATILGYLRSGNPLTLESIFYGIGAAVMMAAVILWFSCYSRVMTSDKFVYLFGRIIPALSLALSMTLRFIPRFRIHMNEVAASQRCIGRDASEGNLFFRIRMGVTILSVMITWSLENAIETADSMRSRAYGLPGRTVFSIYRFDERDRRTMLWLLSCGAYVLAGWQAGGFRFRYYPTMKSVPLTLAVISFYFAFLALCLTPVIIDAKEELEWKHLLSEI